jgi:tRNA (guanine37-N1)-methyltransferase
MSPFRADVLTLFPEMFPGPLGHSLAGKALGEGRWQLRVTDIRNFAIDRHRSVDDAPFGGGAGMVLRPDVVDRAVAAVADGRPLIYLTPRGEPFTQKMARELAAGEGMILLCGRYEGVDQRVIEAWRMREVSIGDYVLSGGEPAAMVVLDAVIRLLPGVVGKEESTAEESFSQGPLLEYPHYTRPALWQGRAVPQVLLSGNHAAIAAWRREQAEAITRTRRPDLWALYLRERQETEKRQGAEKGAQAGARAEPHLEETQNPERNPEESLKTAETRRSLSPPESSREGSVIVKAVGTA